MRTFDVTGMSCSACSTRVEKAVSHLEGIDSCSVNLLTGTMLVEGAAANKEIIDAVTKAGYGATLRGEQKSLDQKAEDSKKLGVKAEEKALKNRLLSSLAILIPLMYLTMGHHMAGLPVPQVIGTRPMFFAIVQLVLTTIVCIINKKFFVNGLRAVLHRGSNMDTLVALGAGASYGYSFVILMKMASILDLDEQMELLGDLYFESAAMILTLITLGKFLEARSKGRTTDAISSLVKLAPKRARVIVDGKEEEVLVDQMKEGDVFLLRAGDRVPVDGIVLEGFSTLDESALTGESIPVDKGEGDSVISASINVSGFLKCKATRVGGDTTLSQIIKLVEEASASKAPISKVADRVSGIFVPTVIGIALVTFIAWYLIRGEFSFSLARAISVLVISCPCALGLATPVAIMVGSGKGAKNGIMFKTAAALEEAGRTEIVALDKTGTITTGSPRVRRIIPLNGLSENEILEVATALERLSTHPLAKAITDEWENRSLEGVQEVTDFLTHNGKGLSGKLNGKTIAVGKADFIRDLGNISHEAENIAKDISDKAETAIYVARQGEVIGLIGISDVIKEDSKKAIEFLKSMGLTTVMITGDSKETAKAIGDEAGVDYIYGEVLPWEKDEIISKLMEHGKTMMVGDGINDGPALIRANTGVAIGRGADVAIDAADVVLVKSSLMDVVGAYVLSRTTLRNIHENLFWAFIYNVLGIPIAIGALIPIMGLALSPMVGALAMSMSSFCVVTNALRINMAKIYDGGYFKNKKRIVLPEKLWVMKEKNENNLSKGEEATRKGDEKMKRKMVIEGMMCGHCEMTVKKVLEGLEGVQEAKVSHEKGEAVISLDKDVPNDVMTKAVEDKDYKVVSIK